ncbi:S-adenosylmethionine:tRNA ribosyltransferase-isomerase, partial [Klebsiella pneumoniae]|uniref:S-adenosylmethionine:tRNA ribosyltransferase-isomerase n=1 Tax=Klebsiella pneumoniae TaxID=573 RepID=UPI003AF85806
IGEKENTGAVIELLLLKNIEEDIWECLAKPGKRLHEGNYIIFGNGELKAKIERKKDEGLVIVKLIYKGILLEILDKLGTMPLPP